MAKKRQTTIQQQLIGLIESADISRYELSKRTGIPPSNLSAFVHGKRRMSLESINAIGLALGLELVRK